MCVALCGREEAARRAGYVRVASSHGKSLVHPPPAFLRSLRPRRRRGLDSNWPRHGEFLHSSLPEILLTDFFDC